MEPVGAEKGLLPRFDALAGAPEVDGLGRHHADPGVAMLGVVPGEELTAKRAPILHGSKAVGEAGAVLEGLELRLRGRVIIGDVRPREGLRDAEVGQEHGDRLAIHGRAAVGVDDELARADLLLLAGVLDEPFGEGRVLLPREHPSGNVAAEDVKDHVEVEVGPLHRTEELVDVPRPDLVWCRGQQLWLPVVGVTELIAPLANLLVLGKDAVHRALRAEVVPLVEKRGIDLSRRVINEARFVEDLQGAPSFLLRQGPTRCPPAVRAVARAERAVVRGPGETHRGTGGRDTEPGTHVGDGVDHGLSSLSGRRIPRISESFFWTSIRASARSARAERRAISRSLAASSRSRGSGICVLGPRFFGASPASSPRSRAERQAVRLEEYTPSLLSRAPSSPGRQASACFRIFRLYSAVNRRRLGLSETSGSGADPKAPAAGGASAETPVALRAPSVPAAPRIPSKDSNCGIFIDLNLPALLTKLQGGQCLTHVGREGARHDVEEDALVGPVDERPESSDVNPVVDVAVGNRDRGSWIVDGTPIGGADADRGRYIAVSSRHQDLSRGP